MDLCDAGTAIKEAPVSTFEVHSLAREIIVRMSNDEGKQAPKDEIPTKTVAEEEQELQNEGRGSYDTTGVPKPKPPPKPR